MAKRWHLQWRRLCCFGIANQIDGHLTKRRKLSRSKTIYRKSSSHQSESFPPPPRTVLSSILDFLFNLHPKWIYKMVTFVACCHSNATETTKSNSPFGIWTWYIFPLCFRWQWQPYDCRPHRSLHWIRFWLVASAELVHRVRPFHFNFHFFQFFFPCSRYPVPKIEFAGAPFH